MENKSINNQALIKTKNEVKDYTEEHEVELDELTESKKDVKKTYYRVKFGSDEHYLKYYIDENGHFFDYADALDDLFKGSNSYNCTFRKK